TGTITSGPSKIGNEGRSGSDGSGGVTSDGAASIGSARSAVAGRGGTIAERPSAIASCTDDADRSSGSTASGRGGVTPDAGLAWGGAGGVGESEAPRDRPPSVAVEAISVRSGSPRVAPGSRPPAGEPAGLVGRPSA